VEIILAVNGLAYLIALVADRFATHPFNIQAYGGGIGKVRG